MYPALWPLVAFNKIKVLCLLSKAFSISLSYLPLVLNIHPLFVRLISSWTSSQFLYIYIYIYIYIYTFLLLPISSPLRQCFPSSLIHHSRNSSNFNYNIECFPTILTSLMFSVINDVTLICSS